MKWPSFMATNTEAHPSRGAGPGYASQGLGGGPLSRSTWRRAGLALLGCCAVGTVLRLLLTPTLLVCNAVSSHHRA